MRTDSEKMQVLQVAAVMAREYVANLQPGDRFLGLVPEAAKHFDIGSEGYNLFVNCAAIELERVAMDLDATNRIISLARVSLQ